MSVADERPRGDANPPATDSKEPPKKDGRVERRSPTRPRFVEGWRKDVKRKVHEANEAPALELTPTARIDIWMAAPDALMKAESALTLLSEADWNKINQINDPANRRSVIAARVLLRIGLSHASVHAVEPADWRFAVDDRGRPVVAAGLPRINFSVSHLDPLVLVAVSATLQVGIDVECIDQNVSPDVIAEFSHLDEHHSVGGLPRPREIREFIRLWTLKEAYTKMVGTGHSLDFKSIKFTLDPVRLNSIAGKSDKERTTQFENFYIGNKHLLYHASLAVRHPAGDSGITEVQIISLADTGGSPSNYTAPMVR
jgi:4'-phosphopantetheinyl transferase